MPSASFKSPISTATESTGEPAWEIARLFPNQGHWEEADYLQLSGNYLIEFNHGRIEVLSMPTEEHQAIVGYLYELLLLFVRPSKLGTVRFAPLRLKVAVGKFREPDLLFVLAAHDALRGNEFWSGADLVMEVVSSDDRRRDLETKRFEYARAAIPEYWIVDPMLREILVLKLDGDCYVQHGRFKEGEAAGSALLAGFEVNVTACLAAASTAS
jgi:Uma2 family endonuclease